MICFEVSLNGQRLTIAGLPGFAVVDTIVDWVNRRGRPGHPASSDLSLRVGGLDSNGPEFSEGTFLSWVERRPLKPGDVVEVRVLERESADPAIAKRSYSKAHLEEDRTRSNRYYLKEHLKRRKEINAVIVRLKRHVRKEELEKAKRKLGKIKARVRTRG